MNNKLIVLSILTIFIFSIASASAADENNTFTSLQTEINEAKNNIEITQDYMYNNESDYMLNEGIVILKDNLTINGNGHTIDGAGQARIFFCIGDNITMLNLNLINGYGELGGAIIGTGIIFENVTFTNNTAKEFAGAIYCQNYTEIKNCKFSANYAEKGSCLQFFKDATIENSLFINNHNSTFSIIYGIGPGNLTVDACTFANSTSKYATAIYSNKRNIIKNSVFSNLHASMTGGAIALKKYDNSEIENCTFIETSAEKNGGALFIDTEIEGENTTISILIKNTTFTKSFAETGGAILQLGGNLTIINSNFSNNYVFYDGAVVYTSDVNIDMENSKFTSNTIINDENFNGGGLYFDHGQLNINNTIFKYNSKNAVYGYDSNVSVNNSIFIGNGEAIHGIFIDYDLNSNNYGNDTLFLNDTDYPSVLIENGMEIKLINNIINVTKIPSQFDSREWGWVSSVKDQGDMGACWAFGICGALESALNKATGIEYDFSENNMQNSMLQYSKYGTIGLVEGGYGISGLGYLLSWFGAFPTEYDTYDELGKISPLFTTSENIHICDAIFVGSRNNATDNDAIKRAIMECGSTVFTYYATDDEAYYNNETYAQYQNNKTEPNHCVSVVGWDDNYPASNFITTPPGNGAFIIKNSWGTEEGDNGYNYISYYDTSILGLADNEYEFGMVIGLLIGKQENYTKIYQRDTAGHLVKENNYTAYKIKYTSVGNDLISGIGSYFKENENYTIEVYVNDVLKHTETGTAPFYGYHTVKLTNEIQIKENDNFTVLMKKYYVPLLNSSRLEFEENTVFVEENGEWIDLKSLEGPTATLKVYTKNLPIFTSDLVKIYKNDSKFEASIGIANETVTFEINGRLYNRTSDENGTAKIAINLIPGNYTIRTTFNTTTVENIIEVLPTLIADNLVKYFRNETQFYISLINGTGDNVAGINITMNINGVFYNRTTDKNGTARLNINLAPGEYILTALDPLTDLQMSYNITVLPILNATDINMTYKDGTQFKATLVNGEGKALINAAVTFNINGVLYTRYTNSSGIACLNINLMAGKYIITSQYESAIISNKITISSKEE